MFKQKIYTVEQVAQYLRVSEDDIRKEINAGRLAALDVAGADRITESQLDAYLKQPKHGKPPEKFASAQQEWIPPDLTPAADFVYTWPDGKNEKYAEVREGVVTCGGEELHAKIGFTVRKSAGRRRRRALVLVNRYATVEFVSANEAGDGKMASIIKDRSGKQLPVGGTIPPEYHGLPVKPYHEVVVGPGASNGLAVVCAEQDLVTMVRHAVIRYLFRRERPPKKQSR